MLEFHFLILNTYNIICFWFIWVKGALALNLQTTRISSSSKGHWKTKLNFLIQACLVVVTQPHRGFAFLVATMFPVSQFEGQCHLREGALVRLK